MSAGASGPHSYQKQRVECCLRSMAGVRVQMLLVVLVGKLLLVSVRAWEPIDENTLRSFYEKGELVEPQEIALPDDTSYSYDDEDFSDTDEDFPEVDGFSSVSFDSPAQIGMQTPEEIFDYVDIPEDDEGGSQGVFAGFPRTWAGRSTQTPDMDVVCTEYGFQVTFLSSLSEVKVLGTKEMLPVVDAPVGCGYKMNTQKNTLNIPFTGCHVKNLATCNATTYSLQFLYVNELDQLKVATAICDEERQPSPRAGGMTGECFQQPQTILSPTLIPPTPSPLPTPTYPTHSLSGLNECTPDQHFFFTIEHNSTSIPVDPTKLVVPGYPECRPIFVNNKVAIFKFKVTKCGSRTYELGDTKVYLAEVQTVVEALNLKYGIITRSHPLRFLVECRYSKTGVVPVSLTTVEFGIQMDSSLVPSVIFSNGIYGVELKIAADETYTSFLPSNGLPVRKVLGTKLYFELNLISPYRDAVLVQKYCIAFPRSAKNALVLIYKGCANPNDPNVYIILSSNHHQKRFVVETFQFMEQKTNLYLDEEEEEDPGHAGVTHSAGLGTPQDPPGGGSLGVPAQTLAPAEQ